MKKAFRFLFSIAAVILLLSGPSAVVAQDETENAVTGLENVQLQVYAEYPSEPGSPPLIILDGQISGATPPVDVRFIVPSGVEMYSAGYIDTAGDYKKGYDYDGPPLTEASGIPGWDIISITVQSTTFVVEYYDPNIITGDKDKAISYQFRWLYPVSDLTAFVQAPLGAGNFEVTPAGQLSSFQGSEYYIYEFNNLPFTNLDEQQPLEFKITYSTGGTNPLLITGIVIGVFAIFTAAYFWTRRRAKTTRPERRRSAKQTARPPQPTAGPAKNGAPARFCRHCGQRLERSSKFCPQCGGNTS